MKEKPRERILFASAINPNEDELEEFINYVSSLCTGKEEDDDEDELEEEGKEKDTEEDKKKNNIERSGDGDSPCGSVD